MFTGTSFDMGNNSYKVTGNIQPLLKSLYAKERSIIQCYTHEGRFCSPLL
jgi:hypothetical protein